MVTGIFEEAERMDDLRSAARSRAKPKPEAKPEGMWWLEYSRKHQRKKAERAGYHRCRWVGGRLYDSGGNEVPGAPRLPKLGEDGKLKQAVGMQGGQPSSRGPRPPSYMRDRNRRDESEQGGLRFRFD